MPTENSKIIWIIVIATVVAAGAFFLFWFFWSSVPEQTPQNNPSQNSQNSGSNQSSVSVNNADSQGQQTQQQTAVAIEAAYTDLFIKILAERANFVRVGSSDTTGVYALYAKDIATAKQIDPQATDFSLSVARADLNDDGSTEALVLNDLPGFCGTGGCELAVYARQSSKWVKLYSISVQGEIGLSNTSNNGYQDLFISMPGVSNNQSQVVRYVWDGKTYKPKEAVAFWDGTGFVVR